MNDEPIWHNTLPTDFMRDGACAGMDTNVFFPMKGQSQKEAMETCNGRPAERGVAAKPGCPVRQQCLEYALSLPYGCIGIWGGTSQRERRQLRFEINKANCVADRLPKGQPLRS